MERSLHKSLNQTIHQPVRLQLMTYLHLAKQANFSDLKKELNITDGNLGSHLLKLEQEKLIRTRKKFIAKKPATIVNITEKGEKELIAYIEILRSVIDK